MLLRYGVSNFRSIRDYQELSLVASSLKERVGHVCEVKCFKEKVLPALAIYGANASGKTNILMAFKFMVDGILNSHKSGSIEGGIRRHFFRLDPQCKNIPTKFDCDFIHKNIRYHFGYTFDDEKIIEEWLYAYPSGTRQIWYFRKYDTPIYFGKFLKGKNKVVESLTRKNSLFISVAAQNNNEQLLEVYKFFKDNFLFSFNNFGKRNSTSDFFSDDRIKYKLVDFLKHADTGITSAKVEDVKPPDNLINFDKKLTDLITMHLGDAKLQYETNIERKRISFAHKGVDGADVYLDINSESKGTLALIKMLGPLFYCLSDGKTVFIDEIDTSMHSLLTTKLINLFNSANSNTNCAQIIFSTHDTSILSCEVLRRDEIYFTEKNNEGSTEIIPLAYIKSRQTDNFERGYLQGRYGGIPFLGNLDDLFVGKEDAE